MSEPTRIEKTQKTVNARYVAVLSGRVRTITPSLGDLRAFVDACGGLPDDNAVRIEPGNLNESGRRNCTFSVEIITEVKP